MALISSSLIVDITFSIAVIFGVSYVYFYYTFKYWEKRGIHYIEPTPFIGNLWTVFLQKESLVDLLRRIYKESAGHKVVGIFIFHKPILVVRDLEVVRSILTKDAHAFMERYFDIPENVDRLFSKSLIVSKGKKWRHLRLKLTPAFTSSKIKKIYHMINDCAERLVLLINQEGSQGRTINVKEVMSRYAMDVIASCAFGVKTNTLEDPNSEFITNMDKLFKTGRIHMLASTLLSLMPWLQKFVSPKFFDDGINDFVRKTFWDVVDYRKANKIVHKDFVDLLVQLREQGEVRPDDANDLEEITQDCKYVENSKQADSDIKLDDDDIVAQAYLFIAAGYETSSTIMSFTLYELAMNPVIQNKVRREIKHILEKHNDQVMYDAIAEMTYLDMVVAESMRKYPLLSMLDRKCVLDCKIEGTDLFIEKGTSVIIPTNGIYCDPNIFPEPEKFDPERFSAENRTKRSNFSFLPFGEGPRKCIAKRFALLHMKTGLVQILKAFQVRPCKETPESPLEMKLSSEILTPKQDIVLSFTLLK